MLNIDDLLTELDVLAVDSTVLTGFAETAEAGSTNLAAKRRIVVDEWLRGALEANHYQPERHLVRRAPDQVYGFTGGVYTDLTDHAGDSTADDINLATVIVSPATDALFVRASQPFRSLWLTMIGTVNVGSICVASPQYWNGGAWTAFDNLVDETRVNTVSLTKGGRLSWQLPTDWNRRPLATDTEWGFWLKLAWSAAPTASTVVSQVLPVRRSRLTPACVYRVLALLYSESWGVQRGEWKEKAVRYYEMADESIAGAIDKIQDEFVLAATDEAVTATMQSSVTVDPSLFILERG
jgi:hypothetical protein